MAVNRERARALFAQSRKVRATFGGHVHWNHAEVIDAVPYITVGSLIETHLTGGRPSGAFAEVTLEDTGRVVVEVRGSLPMQFEYVR